MAEKTQANPDKLKVLNAVMEKIEKDFGKGSIMRMSSAEVADVQVIPTGSITLDMALGVGGYPKGRVIEIFRICVTARSTSSTSGVSTGPLLGRWMSAVGVLRCKECVMAQESIRTVRTM